MRVLNDGGLVGTLAALAFTFSHTAAVGRGGNKAADGLRTDFYLIIINNKTNEGVEK